MEKEFLPYAESLELKELGFNKPCIGRYYSNNEEIPIFMQWTKAVDFNSILLPLPYPQYGENISPFISAPLVQQVFRFFREKYGYWIYVREASKRKCRFYIEKFDEKYFTSEIFDTYEEAELACIRKLIELAKEQNVK